MSFMRNYFPELFITGLESGPAIEVAPRTIYTGFYSVADKAYGELVKSGEVSDTWNNEHAAFLIALSAIGDCINTGDLGIPMKWHKNATSEVYATKEAMHVMQNTSHAIMEHRKGKYDV